MKHAFRPTVTDLESRLVLSTASVAAHLAASKAVATVKTTTPVAPSMPAAVATAIATHLYQETLGRKPDAVGLAVAVPAIQSGTTIAQMTTALVTSPEYIANNISAKGTSVANETQYVTALYNTVLGRAPEGTAVTAWVNAIESHAVTLYQAAAAIVASPEAATSPTSILVYDAL